MSVGQLKVVDKHPKAAKPAQAYATLKDTKPVHMKMKGAMASAQDIVSEVLARGEWAKLRNMTGSSTEARKKRSM